MANELAVIDSGAIAATELAERRNNNSRVVDLWLSGRPAATIDAYRRDVADLRRFLAEKWLGAIDLEDLQRYAAGLAQSGMSDGTRRRRLASIRSLLTFAQKTGLIPLNVGAALQAVRVRDGLADRILTVRETRKVLRAAGSPRDTAMLALFYDAGIRRGELRGLRWRDVVEAERGGAHITVLGKGAKTRTVLVSRDTYALIAPLRGDAPLDAPVFAGRSGGPMDPSSIWRVVRRTARRAGSERAVSPHFFRHAHASHALDAGAPIALVRDTLGHSSVAVTDRYLHARPNESSGRYLKR